MGCVLSVDQVLETCSVVEAEHFLLKLKRSDKDISAFVVHLIHLKCTNLSFCLEVIFKLQSYRFHRKIVVGFLYEIEKLAEVTVPHTALRVIYSSKKEQGT